MKKAISRSDGAGGGRGGRGGRGGGGGGGGNRSNWGGNPRNDQWGGSHHNSNYDLLLYINYLKCICSLLYEKIIHLFFQIVQFYIQLYNSCLLNNL